MKNKKNLIFIILLILLSLLCVYFFIQKEQQKEKIATQQQAAKELTLMNKMLSHIKGADSLLIAGRYSLALEQYEQQLLNVPDSLKAYIQQKMDLVKKYRNLQNRLINVEADTIVDTVKQNIVINNASSSQLDSIQFALRKAKIKIASLQKQILKQTGGEYLVFQSSKGSTMYYVGQVENEMANGQGVALLETGSRYEGEWKNNMRHGEGTFYWKDGEYYEGSYVNDKREGNGKYFWPNGEKYVGEWSNDKRNGQGTFYNKEGEVLAKGRWKNDELIKQNK